MVAQITSEFARRRDTAFARARELVERDPEGFAEAGRRLGEWFPAKWDHGPEQDVEFLLSDRIERAARAASVDDHFLLPLGRSFSFVRNEAGHDRDLAARMTILALLLGGDPRANEVVTPDICDLAVLPWDSEWGAEPGRHMVGWRTHDWPHNDEPSLGVLQRLEEAVERLEEAKGKAEPNGAPLAVSAEEAPPSERQNSEDAAAVCGPVGTAVSEVRGPTIGEMTSEAGISLDTFRRIRKAAGIHATELGGAARKRGHPPHEVDLMLEAVERGNFLERKGILLKWVKWGTPKASV